MSDFEEHADEALAAAYNEVLPMLEAAHELAAGKCGVVVDYKRKYATADTRVPAEFVLDVTACGIERVNWNAQRSVWISYRKET